MAVVLPVGPTSSGVSSDSSLSSAQNAPPVSFCTTSGSQCEGGATADQTAPNATATWTHSATEDGSSSLTGAAQTFQDALRSTQQDKSASQQAVEAAQAAAVVATAAASVLLPLMPPPSPTAKSAPSGLSPQPTAGQASADPAAAASAKADSARAQRVSPSTADALPQDLKPAAPAPPDGSVTTALPSTAPSDPALPSGDAAAAPTASRVGGSSAAAPQSSTGNTSKPPASTQSTKSGDATPRTGALPPAQAAHSLSSRKEGGSGSFTPDGQSGRGSDGGAPRKSAPSAGSGGEPAPGSTGGINLQVIALQPNVAGAETRDAAIAASSAAERADVARQIAGRITTSGSPAGAQTVTVSVTPGHWGALKISLSTSSSGTGASPGGLTATIVAETPAVRDALMGEVKQLRTALEGAGVKLDKLDIVAASESAAAGVRAVLPAHSANELNFARGNGQNSNGSHQQGAPGSGSSDLSGRQQGRGQQFGAMFSNDGGGSSSRQPYQPAMAWQSAAANGEVGAIEPKSTTFANAPVGRAGVNVLA